TQSRADEGKVGITNMSADESEFPPKGKPRKRSEPRRKFGGLGVAAASLRQAQGIPAADVYRMPY
ncbi:MAG: hypothetical protein Q7S40_18870, partial [Opitutaceae bacterium]|nr:hypothetical protein [Opitutaceae bacterium]